ncbi:MAG: hypothetical protein MRZ79_23890 [Bacteroidia bacterium]|nr:hypothetical protein [Bacteroidia bacterium]
MEEPFYCAQNSKDMGNPLIGTVKPFSYLFLLEYPGTFEAKAVGQSSLPSEVKDHISVGLKSISSQMGSARLLLIKNQASQQESEKSLFVFHNDPQNPVVRRYTLERYEQLLRAPLKNLIDPKGGDPVEKPMYLVCTNGLRDKCCSKFGFPLYRKLYQSLDNPEKYVWESSHVGGHRFAGNIVTLPNGCFYGFVEEEDIDELVSKTENNEMLASRLRGRSSIPNVAQAVELFLRENQNDWKLSSFEWEGIHDLGDALLITKARFKGVPYWVRLKKEKIMVGGSCDSPESKEGSKFLIDSIERR